MNRLGLRRFPVLTLVVFAVTAAMALWQAADHRVLTTLQRAPEGLHGDWWRTFTALFVQDGGLLGGFSNLLFLLAVGTAAEQVVSRRQWLVQYFGTGLVVELIAYAWQPVGGGNSIAVCGLTGVVAVALWRGEQLPGFTTWAVVVWSVALLTTQWHPFWLQVAFVVVAAAGFRFLGPAAGRAVAVVVPVLGALLAAFANIHGAALLIGLAIAVPVAVLRRQYPSSSSALR